MGQFRVRSRFWRDGDGRYRTSYKGRTVRLWKGRDERGRPIWFGAIELQASTFHMTRESMLEWLRTSIDKADLGKPSENR